VCQRVWIYVSDCKRGNAIERERESERFLFRKKPGLDFINDLRTAFTPVVPQSVRTQSSRQYLFTLLGPTSVKAVRRMLKKLTPGSSPFFSRTFLLSLSLSLPIHGQFCSSLVGVAAHNA